MLANRVIHVVAAHAEGEVGRVITGGVLPPPGDTVFAQSRYLRDHADEMRLLLMREPRGGPFTHYNLIVPAKDPRAAAGFIIMEPEDYPPMSGSNAICVATVLLETGMIAMREPVTEFTLEAPGGLVPIRAQCAGGKCRRVALRNIASFVAGDGLHVEVEGLGSIPMALAFGGDFFVMVDAAALGLTLGASEAREMVELGERIKQAAWAQHQVAHPENPEITRISFTQFMGPVETVDGVAQGKSAVVISPGKIDRSPTGTGVSARLALMHARGEIGLDEPYRGLSPLDTMFEGRIVAETRVGALPAITPEISGRGFVTGVHAYTLDPDDPFPTGYALSDVWRRPI